MAKKKVVASVDVISPMTTQEVFDRVTSHLVQQNEPAVSEVTTCGRLLVADGKTCAVGCLIPRGLYDPKMEKVSAELDKLFAYKGLENLAPHKDLLHKLQKLHDTKRDLSFVEKKPLMRAIAYEFKLVVPKHIALS